MLSLKFIGLIPESTSSGYCYLNLLFFYLYLLLIFIYSILLYISYVFFS